MTRVLAYFSLFWFDSSSGIQQHRYPLFLVIQAILSINSFSYRNLSHQVPYFWNVTIEYGQKKRRTIYMNNIILEQCFMTFLLADLTRGTGNPHWEKDRDWQNYWECRDDGGERRYIIKSCWVSKAGYSTQDSRVFLFPCVTVENQQLACVYETACK